MRGLVTLSIVLALSAPLSACGSSAPMGPKAARRAAVISAALAQKSVHWFADDYELVEGEWSIDADVTGDSGRAELNWRAEGDGGEYQLVYVKGMYYVRGDSESLRWFLNLTKAEAARYAGRWISTLNGKRLMFGLTDGLTLPSVAREYPWTEHRTSASATGERLPSKFWKRLAPDEWLDGHFSKWNEPLNIQAPASSTPIATVRGG